MPSAPMVDAPRQGKSANTESTLPEVAMFPNIKNHDVSAAASIARDTARQAAAQVKPVAAHAKPLAANTAAATRRRVLRTRAWAAPQIERTGQALEDSVAPKVSALLSSAARRVEPSRQRRRRGRALVAISMLTVAAGAVAILARNRRKAASMTSPANADAGTMAPAAARADDQPRTDAHADVDADVNGRVGTR